jgi:hypothetical protein
LLQAPKNQFVDAAAGGRRAWILKGIGRGIDARRPKQRDGEKEQGFHYSKKGWPEGTSDQQDTLKAKTQRAAGMFQRFFQPVENSARPVFKTPGRADHNTCKYSPASLGDQVFNRTVFEIL